jgi:hypothetical protein
MPLKNRLNLLSGRSRQTVECTPVRVLFPNRGSLNCGRNCRSSTLFQFGELSVSTALSLTWPSAARAPT